MNKKANMIIVWSATIVGIALLLFFIFYPTEKPVEKVSLPDVLIKEVALCYVIDENFVCTEKEDNVFFADEPVTIYYEIVNLAGNGESVYYGVESKIFSPEGKEIEKYRKFEQVQEAAGKGAYQVSRKIVLNQFGQLPGQYKFVINVKDIIANKQTSYEGVFVIQ